MPLNQRDLDYMVRYILPLVQLRAALAELSVPPGPPSPKYTSLITQLDTEISAAFLKMTSLP